MDIQEFKQRLEAQGVAYDYFILRTLEHHIGLWETRGDVENRLIRPNFTFYGIIAEAFIWESATEGKEYWQAVAWERGRLQPSGQGPVYPPSVSKRCTCELYSLLRDGCKCGGS